MGPVRVILVGMIKAELNQLNLILDPELQLQYK